MESVQTAALDSEQRGRMRDPKGRTAPTGARTRTQRTEDVSTTPWDAKEPGTRPHGLKVRPDTDAEDW